MSNIEWRKVRDELVPPLSVDEPAVAYIRAQLRWLDEHTVPEGNELWSGRSYKEIQHEFRQYLLDEIERYHWEKAGFTFTKEIRDACRESK